eukprot:5427122-Alexandrium_andersonii.AAC.1
MGCEEPTHERGHQTGQSLVSRVQCPAVHWVRCSLCPAVHCARLFAACSQVFAQCKDVLPSAQEPPNRPENAKQDVVSGVPCVQLCPASSWCSGSVRELCPYVVSGGVVSGCSPAGH